MLSKNLKVWALVIWLLSFLCVEGKAGITEDTDDTINCGSAASTDGLTQITSCVRASLPSLTGYMPLMPKRTTGNNEWNFFVENSKLFFYHSGTLSGGEWTCDLTGTSTNAFHTFCVTVNTGSASNDPIFYVDGSSCTLVDDTNPGGAYDTNNGGSTLYIGNEAEFGSDNGQTISEAFLANTVLSSTTISNYSLSKRRNIILELVASSNLVGVWNLDDQPAETSINGDTIRDLSANANHCTGDDGANNAGATWVGENFVNYPSGIIQ